MHALAGSILAMTDGTLLYKATVFHTHTPLKYYTKSKTSSNFILQSSDLCGINPWKLAPSTHPIPSPLLPSPRDQTPLSFQFLVFAIPLGMWKRLYLSETDRTCLLPSPNSSSPQGHCLISLQSSLVSIILPYF